MNKKAIDKMFLNMTESCEVVKNLYSKGYYEYMTAQKQIDEYRQYYMNTLNGLLILKIIKQDKQEYGYELLKNWDIDLLDF